jgi:hypothetical protein
MPPGKTGRAQAGQRKVAGSENHSITAKNIEKHAEAFCINQKSTGV